MPVNPTEDSETTACTVSSDDLGGSELDPRLFGLTSWSCSRPVWDDERCIWHADAADKPVDDLAGVIGDGDLHGARVSDTDLTSLSLPDDTGLVAANLSGTTLRDADLPGANLRNADLSGAYLYDADLSGANLLGADLPGANLRNADLSGADLLGANLSGADLLGADLSGANLYDADFSEADLRHATLDHVGIYATSLQNVQVNEGTSARPPSRWERQADADTESGVFSRRGIRRLRLFNRWPNDPEDLVRAEQQYRRIERLYRENDLKPNPALTVQEKHARRKRAFTEGNLFQWLRRAFSRWVLGYGLLIRPIIGVMLVVIVGCALAYPIFGFEDGTLAASTTETATVMYETVPPEVSLETARTFGRSLYFSTITFSTLGYGDLFPTGWARALATVESFIGALSMAYLVSVLSRRAIR
jgi:uncharacterized protein YjbI with pentapeptide repeats